MKLRSPLSGEPLVADGPHALAAPGERWPVVDGIPFLRTGREALAREVLACLDRDRRDEALILLLADQDDWWTGPATDADELRQLVQARDTLSLREAMALLRFGPVADYFAYRWSDPTYLAGLALVEAHWDRPASAFELACGIGHFLRDLDRCGVRCTGADVVFAKCWLARHWVAPRADYVVFDAAAPWPIDGRFDLAMCHDAFYFLPDQVAVAQRLREACMPGGTLAISHLHNSEHRAGARGPARSCGEWQALFGAATVYDERELRRALLAADAPQPSGWHDDDTVEAWSIVEGNAGPPRALTGGLVMPGKDEQLVRNPLMTSGGVSWPSDRYRDEYAAGCAWADAEPANGSDDADARSRRLVSLPERW